jgi:hypothetical protein
MLALLGKIRNLLLTPLYTQTTVGNCRMSLLQRDRLRRNRLVAGHLVRISAIEAAQDPQQRGSCRQSWPET